MRKILTVIISAVFVLSLAQGVGAQRRAAGGATEAELRELRKEVEALREGQRAIQAELEEIKKILREVASKSVGARPTTVSVDDDPSIGESTAKVVLIDFSDYQ